MLSVGLGLLTFPGKAVGKLILPEAAGCYVRYSWQLTFGELLHHRRCWVDKRSAHPGRPALCRTQTLPIICTPTHFPCCCSTTTDTAHAYDSLWTLQASAKPVCKLSGSQEERQYIRLIICYAAHADGLPARQPIYASLAWTA